MRYQLEIEDREYSVEIGAIEDGWLPVTVNDKVLQVNVENLIVPAPNAGAACREGIPAGTKFTVNSIAKDASWPLPSAAVPTTASPSVAVPGNGAVKAPIPGLILSIKVAVGDSVTAGQTVATMEAMKMENNIGSPMDGKVLEIRVAKDATVADGDVIMVIG